MVAIAGAARGQTEPIPTFAPALHFFDGGTARSFAWGVAAGKVAPNEPYPDVVVAYGEADRIALTEHTPTSGVVQVWNNMGSWSVPQNGLSVGQTISLGLDVCPGEVVLADIDADEDLDLIISAGYCDVDPGPPTVPSWTGIITFENSGGTFGAMRSYFIDRGVLSLAVADLNNDGLPDIAAAFDPWEQREGDRDVVHVFKNDPENQGEFIDLGTRDTGHASPDITSNAVVIGDFNRLTIGPQHMDIVSAGVDSDDVSVLKGTGNFAYTTTLDLGCQDPDFPCRLFRDTVAGSFSANQQRLDLAGIPDDLDRRVMVLRGNANGHFFLECPPVTYPAYFAGGGGGVPLAELSGGLTLGQLNGGSKPDIIVGDTSYSRFGVVCMLGKQDAGATFQIDNSDVRYCPAITGANPFNVCAADLDQDGFDDIITSNHGDVFDEGAASLSVLINEMMTITP